MKENRSCKRVISLDADVKSDVLFHHENHGQHEKQALLLYRRCLTKHETADAFKQKLAQIHFKLLIPLSKEGKYFAPARPLFAVIHKKPAIQLNIP